MQFDASVLSSELPIDRSRPLGAVNVPGRGHLDESNLVRDAPVQALAVKDV